MNNNNNNNNNNINSSNNNIWKKKKNNNPNDHNKNFTKNLFFNNKDNEFKHVYEKKNMQGQRKKKNNVAYDTYDNNDIHASSQYTPFVNTFSNKDVYSNNNKYVDNTFNKKPFHNNTDNKNQGVHHNMYVTNEYNKNNFRNKGLNNNTYGPYQNIYTTEDKNNKNLTNSEGSNFINTDKIYSSNINYMNSINKNDTRNVYNLYKNHYNNKTKDNNCNKRIADYSYDNSYDNNLAIYKYPKYVSSTNNNITNEDAQSKKPELDSKHYLHINEKNENNYQNIQKNLNNTQTLYNNYKNVPSERDHIHNNNNKNNVQDILSHCINVLLNDNTGLHDLKIFYETKLRERNNNELIKYVLNKINDITIKYKYHENNINFIAKEIYELQRELKNNNNAVSNFSTYNKNVRGNVYQTNKYINTNVYNHEFNKNNEEVYHQKVHNEEVYDKEIYHEEIYDKEIYNKEIYNKEIYNKEIYHEEVYNKIIQHNSYNINKNNDQSFINSNVYKGKDNALVSNTKTHQGLYKLQKNTQNVNLIENKINCDIKSQNILIHKYYKKHEEYKKKWEDIIYKCKQTNVLKIFYQVEGKIKDNIKILDIFKLYLFPQNNYFHYKNVFYNNYKMITIHNVKFLFLQNLFTFHKKIKNDSLKNTQPEKDADQIIKNNLNKDKENDQDER
ncbi:hypothetical protein PFNF135_00647 [Plasmodium falciparum NF135/5.C10]|uniref:Uncharacterized protein n=1 Tax=Plasmodium falciparum NF135/5.C10 TaxID=1036726 RepID=W4IN10_PLAFA|nr:hypothetical protein PFNF135_00647 [Plasmodium falciparum NF135/5.C10]